jgi:ABC-type branched-subunit amino acid transport system permease subunit
LGLSRIAGLICCAVVLVLAPYWTANQYYLHIVSLIGVYWILIAGLNLVVGFSGQLSIGHVGLLAIGAYAFAILTGTLHWSPFLALLVAGAAGGISGLLIGLPSLRLPGFYFAMVTMAFALIINEFALAHSEITGGGVGLAVPSFPGLLATPRGFYWLILGIGAVVTWLTWNISRYMWGRGLIAIRDSVIAAAAVGVPVYRAKLVVFVASGINAGIAGALFGGLQTYISPETFVFDLSLFFFVAIIIGGRGSLLGPFIGTVILAALPELVSPLAKLGTFFYGLLLLLVVLLVPEGLGRMIERAFERMHSNKQRHHVVSPNLERLISVLKEDPQA